MRNGPKTPVYKDAYMFQQREPIITSTVQLIALEEDKILLVHHKKYSEKRVGWGLPGGGVPCEDENGDTDKSKITEMMLDSIINRFLWFYKLGTPEEFAKDIGENHTDINDPNIFLTVIKEGIEETGLLFFPESIMLVDPSPGGINLVYVIKVRRLRGKLLKSSIETDNSCWFPTDGLPEADGSPEGIYRNHLSRIERALQANCPEMKVGTKKSNIVSDGKEWNR